MKNNESKFGINKRKDICNGCGNYQIPYKENIHWEIKFNPDVYTFSIFFYVEEKEGLRVFEESITDDTLKASLGDKEKIDSLVEDCFRELSKLIKLNVGFKNRK